MNANRPDQIDKMDEFEEFDQEEFDEPAPPPQTMGAKFGAMWRDNPGFKMLVILGAGAVVLGGAYAFMNSSSKPVGPDVAPSRVAGAPEVKGTPGADVTPEYKKLLEESNKKSAEEALKTGGSAIPTPVGNVAETTPKLKEEPVDPLAMWRQAEAQTQAPPPQLNLSTEPQQQQQQANNETQQLSQAMQQQITSLMQAWGPTQATVVTFAQPSKTTTTNAADGTTTTTTTGAAAGRQSVSTTTTTKLAKVIVPAGDIHYGAMITEANSDVPGPILAQVLSGPLKGGRLIGAFQATDELLVMKFTTLSIGGRTYAVEALALDPNTTLGGMATETDQRYFSRLVVPAAAAFVSRFGDAISQQESTTSVSNGTVVTTTKKSSTKDALYGGAGDAANQLSQFASQEASRIRPLVRVASDTAIGIFFIKPVTDQPQERQQ